MCTHLNQCQKASWDHVFELSQLPSLQYEVHPDVPKGKLSWNWYIYVFYILYYILCKSNRKKLKHKNTWPRLAAAIGWSSNSLNSSWTGAPNSLSIKPFAFVEEKAGSLSWNIWSHNNCEYNMKKLKLYLQFCKLC